MNDINKRIAALSPEKRKILLEKLKKTSGDTSHKIVKQGRETNKFPPSFAQQRLWFLDQMEPNSSTYNIPIAFRLTGSLHLQALEQTVNEIIRRHEALRTTFATEYGQPFQVIAQHINVPLPVVDLSKLPAAQKQAEFERRAHAESDCPFDLAKGPLVRAQLLKLDETEHVFFMSMHHIVSDGWTIGVLLKELEAHYRAFSKGEPASLPELPIQYADFSVWQRNWLRGEQLEKQLSFWKKELANAPSSLELPTVRPRPAVQTFSGGIHRLKLPASLSKAVNSLSQKAGVTLFMTLLASFKILLYRYTGQEDIVVGSPIANRSRPEIEDLIGFFVNTMVLRTAIRGELTFNELLSRIQKITLAAYDHQDLPFEKLVEELQPQRDLSSTPFFQVMFVLQNSPLDSLELPGLILSPLAGEVGLSRFDLSLYCGEGEEGLIGMFEFNTDLFDAVTIRRMAGHFQRLLESIIENPDQCISRFSMLTEGEEQRLLVDCNATALDYPSDQCLHHLFEAQVKKTPEATAIVMNGEELTYQELNSRSNCLAHYLQNLGTDPDVLVGICVERSLEMVIGLLGIMKAGGAYVPLDPSYPKERLAYMVEDSGLSILLSQKQVFGELLEDRESSSENSNSPFSRLNSQNRVICLDSDWEEIAKENDANSETKIESKNLAYVIYTSGSTGKPKGVAIQHQTLLNFLTSMAQEPGLTQDDTLLAVTTLSFDIAGLELYLPLLVGARVILASREVAADGSLLGEMLAESCATVMQATPATWNLLLDSGWQGGKKLKILCGGEALPRELARRLLNSGSLWNMYGPTETTIWSAVCQLESKEEMVPVGPPINNTQFYILDRNLQAVPVGVFGELCIGGDCLARGYLKRPELTAEKFIPNPFSKEGARMYRTGDLVRYLSNGKIEFNGRIDHQVKIRGFRIELGEIEAQLARHMNVDEAVVVARGDGGDVRKEEKRLVAYLISKAAKVPTVSELRRFLQESMPEYMLPTVFMFLDAFPKTPNGKVDRKALPAPEGNRPELESAYIAPQNEVERTIAEIWQEVLGVEKVGVDDNFFDLGGHSLLLVQVQSKFTAIFKRDLSIIDLFKYPTIKAQGKYFSSIQQESEENNDLSKAQDLARKQRDALSRRKQLAKEFKKDEEPVKYA